MAQQDLLFKVGADTSAFEKSMSGMATNLLKMTAGFFAINKIGQLFKAMANEAIEGEKVMNLLTNSILKAKGGSVELVGQMDALARKIGQATGISNELIKEGFMKMTDATGSATAAFKGIEPAIALSIARNIDLSAAVDLVSRAYMSGTDVLKRQKIYIADNVKGQDALNAITAKYKGVVETYGGTAEAKIKGMNESFKQAGETMGRTLLPAMESAAKLAQETANWWEQFVNKIVEADTKKKAIEALAEIDRKIAESYAKQGALKAELDANGEYSRRGLKKEYEDEIDNTNKLIALKKIAVEVGNKKKPNAGGGDTGDGTVSKLGLSAGAEAALKAENADIKRVLEEKWAMIVAEESAGETSKSKIQENATKKYNEWILNQNNFEKTSAIKNAEDILKEKQKEYQDKYDMAQKYGMAVANLDAVLHSKHIQNIKSATGELKALMGSRNRTLFEIGKAAAMANVAIETAESAMNIYKGFSQIPVVGLILGIAGAAAAIAFGAEQTATIAETNFNPKGAAAGMFNTTGEPLISTFQPTEAVIPERFSEGIRRGDYALTSGSNTTNNSGQVNLHFAIHSNGLDNAKNIVRSQIIPEFKKYLINERGGNIGKITGNAVVPNF